MKKVSAKQLPRNLLMNAASFLFNIIVGLWLVPYLIGHVGIAAYGLIPLAMIFNEYISLITHSFNGAVSRYLTVEIQGGNKEGALVIFNSSFALVLILFFLQGGISVFIINDLDSFISIPSALLIDAVWLFGLTFAGFILSTLSAVFSVSMFSSNRVDLMRINDIVRQATKITVVIFLFSIYEPKLVHVGVANFLAGFSFFILSIIRWRELTPELVIDFTKVSFSRIKPMARLAGWILINTIGYLLFLRIDTYIVNRFIGLEACGEYAAILQWNQLVRTAAGVLSGAITPLGLAYYARGEHEKLLHLMQLAMKCMGLALAIPLGLLCAFSSDVLAAWLGPEFRHLGGLMVLQLCTLVINLGVLPLFALNTAMDRVKVPALLTCAMGGVNFVLAIWFVSTPGWGYYGVAAAGAIVLTLKNALFTPLYAAHILRLPKMTFFRPLVSGGLAFLVIFISGNLLSGWIRLQGLVEIGLVLLALCVAAFLPVFWGGLSVRERTILAHMVPNRMRYLCRKVLLVPG